MDPASTKAQSSNAVPALTLKRTSLAAAGLAMAMAFYLALKAKPVSVDTSPLSRATLTVTVDEEGKTSIKDVYVVAAPLAGRLLRAPVHVGDAVEKNASIVAVIQPSPPAMLDVRTRAELESAAQAATAALTLAEAELAQAKSELHFAEADMARAKALMEKAVTTERTLQKTQIDVETRTAGVARAAANVALRKREVESAQVRLMSGEQTFVQRIAELACCYEVKSPESGRILKLIAESETTVSTGAPLLEIGDPANLDVTVELLSSDAVKVRIGAGAVIDGWGGAPLNARVTKIYPSGFTKVSALGIEEQRVKVILAFEDPAAERERLGHDFRVFARIHVFEAAGALRVPLSALFRRGEQWAAFVADQGIARERAVSLGERNSSFAQVLSGLKEGDRIILHPSDKVADGVAISDRTNGG
ncbi:MAG: HlyD family efflux transporter periplasmic adaptor subunit [Hyphomicrobium sp.]